MYFFYVDESGSRDPSVVDAIGNSKDHIYVLMAVGMYEKQWTHFENDITGLKLYYTRELRRAGHEQMNIANCEVKSNWIRSPRAREKHSPFLHALSAEQREELVARFFDQLEKRHAVIFAVVIDKRELRDHITHETMHKKAYELLLERIEHYLAEYHPKHNGLIIMDDTSKQLNQAVALKHAYFQRDGNQNMAFPHIVEYPFFSVSELSNGVQLSDLLAYNVYRAFKEEDMAYPYFKAFLPHFYRRRSGTLSGLKVWPETSSLVSLADSAGNEEDLP